MEKFIHGMDISSMDEVVGLGGKYYDKGCLLYTSAPVL